MALQAIVTAGGKLPRGLKQLSSSPVKALLKVGDRTLLDSALRALIESRLVERVAVVGDAEVKAAVKPPVEYVQMGATVADNCYNAFRVLGGEANDYLIVSPDLPFLKAAALQEFITGTRSECDIGLPVVAKEDFMERFPGAANRFERLDGRKVTMGSCMYVTGPSLVANIPLARDMFSARKYVWRIAVFLGLPIIWGYFTGTLKSSQVEGRLSQLTGCRVRAVPVADATIAYDVDDRENFDYAIGQLRR